MDPSSAVEKVQEDSMENVVEEEVVKEEPTPTPKKVVEEPSPASKKVLEEPTAPPKTVRQTDVKKINLGSAVNVPLSLATRGTRLASDQFEKFAVAEKFSAVRQHPMAVKVVNRVSVSAELLWVVLGFVLILHGAQFKNLFLCSQVVVFFCFDRMKESVSSITSDVMTAWNKMLADAPSNADAKAEPKPAQKRNSKKTTDADACVDVNRKQAEDAAVMKKALKALDSDKVARSAFDLFASFMACHMVIHFGSMQVVVIAHALVIAAKKRIFAIFDFVGLDDLVAWTDLFVSFFLYVIFGFVAVFIAPLALALNLAVCGAHLVMEHGLPLAQAMGRIESADKFAGSMKGLLALGGLIAFGTFWQLWALAANSGMAWYFSILYMPGVMGEMFVSAL